MKKYLPLLINNFPLIFGIFLLIGGLSTLRVSIPGALLLLLSGLILLPASNNFIIQKVKLLSFLGNTYKKYFLVIIFFMLSTPIVEWSEKRSLIDKFKTENIQIIKEVSNLQDKKEFQKADYLIGTYLKALPSNEQLLTLKSDNDAKQTAEKEALAAKKLAEESAASAKFSSRSDGSQPGYMYVLTNTSTSRIEATYPSYGACSAAKASKQTTDWTCIGRPKFTNE